MPRFIQARGPALASVVVLHWGRQPKVFIPLSFLAPKQRFPSKQELLLILVPLLWECLPKAIHHLRHSNFLREAAPPLALLFQVPPQKEATLVRTLLVRELRQPLDEENILVN